MSDAQGHFPPFLRPVLEVLDEGGDEPIPILFDHARSLLRIRSRVHGRPPAGRDRQARAFVRNARV
jgi:hypothetical protein